MVDNLAVKLAVELVDMMAQKMNDRLVALSAVVRAELMTLMTAMLRGYKMVDNWLTNRLCHWLSSWRRKWLR